MRSWEIWLRKLKLSLMDNSLITTRPPILPSGINRFTRSWFFGDVAPRICSKCGPRNSWVKALDYELDGPGSLPGVGGLEIILHSLVSRLVLGSTQPPIKLISELSPVVKAVECRTSHPTSSYCRHNKSRYTQYIFGKSSLAFTNRDYKPTLNFAETDAFCCFAAF